MTKIKNNLKLLVNNNKYLFLIRTQYLRLKSKFRRSIVGKNNEVINNGVSLNVKYDIIGNNNRIEIMHRSILSNLTIFIRGNNHKLRIEEDCVFKDGTIWFEDSMGEISIGCNTSIESAHFAVTEINTGIYVGEDCMFSNGIELRTGDSHAIVDVVKNMKINDAQNISIGNHVWIGSGAKILKGVSIGNNSVVGTGSIVTRDIPSNSISAGIPAKVIKTNVNWVRDRFYN
jgi:acetyltransferase-like isoleucine patch superfamily enzyme